MFMSLISEVQNLRSSSGGCCDVEITGFVVMPKVPITGLTGLRKARHHLLKKKDELLRF